MKSIQLFNGLNGTIATRNELQEIVDVAKIEEQNHIASKLENVLFTNNDSKFDIEISENAFEIAPQSFLSGVFFEDETDLETFGLAKPVTPSMVYDMITNKVIEMIKQSNEKDYTKKWKQTGYTIPFNFVSKKRYRGVNVVMLTMLQELENPFFLTFKQVQELGGKVKKGASGYEVVYYTKLYKIEDKERNLKKSDFNEKKVIDFKNENGIENEVDYFPMLKYYNVYNGKDIEGIDFKLDTFKIGYIESDIKPHNDNKMPVAEAIIKNYPTPAPPLKHGGNGAFYSPSKDFVQMPKFESFETVQDYYRTLFHEFSHSTGHPKRLSRDFSGKFGSKPYALEELVAELGAIFLSAEAGIIWHNNKNHAAYLKSWNSALTHAKDDNKFIMKAATLAQKVADFVLQFDENGNPLYFKDVKLENTKIEVKKTKVAPKPTKTPAKKLVKKPVEKVVKPTKKTAPKVVKPPKKVVKKPVEKPKPQVIVIDDNFAKEVKFQDDFTKYFAPIFLKKFNKKFEFRYRDMYSTEMKKFIEKHITIFNNKKSKKTKATPKVKATPTATSKKVQPTATNSKLVYDLDIATINIDTKRFQNRSKLNEDVLKNIVNNYSLTELDPVMVWVDTNGKTYLLAGHHRLEATKRVGYTSIPAKYFAGTETEAIEFAKVKSNANRSMETDFERAKIYRTMRENGATKKAIQEKASEIEGKNANTIINYSYLKENGVVLQALESLDRSDKQNKSTIETQADWIGEARRNNEKLTNAHEVEMFQFLQDRTQSERIKNKRDFLQKIHAVAGGFDFNENSVLNLKKFKYKSEGESAYDEEFNTLKSKIDEINENRANLKDRLANPKNPNYINPSSQDYEVVLGVFDKALIKYNEELKLLQSQLMKLQQSKGNYTNAGSNQAALFGVKKSKIQKIGLAGNGQKSEFYNVAGAVGEFLQAVEKKPYESVVITMDGQQGAGKTTTLYKFMDSFAKTGNKCLFLSLEEHPSSSLAKDKVNQYLSSKATQNIDSVGEVESVNELYEFVQDYEIIFIDSWQKLQRMVGNIRLDEDLRKKFNGKVFVVIFQQTTTGRTKGGAEVVFDGDIIIKMVKEHSFSDNYAYFDKNRYTKIPIENIRYNIATGTVYNPNAPQEPARIEPTENVEFSFIIN